VELDGIPAWLQQRVHAEGTPPPPAVLGMDEVRSHARQDGYVEGYAQAISDVYRMGLITTPFGFE
jgi:hypothetical protein